MPRDSAPTKARLLREAERLFARRGVYRVTLREITEAAEQRNASALNYHFGSREGVLDAILLRHGDPLDDERGRLLADLGHHPSARDLITALLVPYARCLATPEGRDYLRIVAQLTGAFPNWRAENALNPPNLRRILGLLEDAPSHLPPDIRRERLLGLILLMTTAMAERARLSSRSRAPDLAEDVFLANLADMMAAALEAPVGPLLQADDPAFSRHA